MSNNHRIIQDCEDALTNWVESNAAVRSNLSTRARTLSQRRVNNIRNRGEGHDLSGQDSQMQGDRESGLWVPASAHQGSYEDDEEQDGEERGREEDRVEA